jgi:hypothetical protein
MQHLGNAVMFIVLAVVLLAVVNVMDDKRQRFYKTLRIITIVASFLLGWFFV